MYASGVGAVVGIVVGVAVDSVAGDLVIGIVVGVLKKLEANLSPVFSELDETVVHAVTDGKSVVCTASCDALCENVKVLSEKSYWSGAKKSLTSIGDKEVLVCTTVGEAGTDDA